MAFVLDQSYTDLNLAIGGSNVLRTTWFNGSGIHTFTKLAQSFTPSITKHTNRIELRLRNVNGTPSGNIWATIQSDIGGEPSGSVLGISQLKPCTQISGDAYYGFDFILPTLTEEGVKYWTVLEGDYPIALQPWIEWIADGMATYANNKFLSYATSWEDLANPGGANDALFRQYYGSGQNLILFDV